MKGILIAIALGAVVSGGYCGSGQAQENEFAAATATKSKRKKVVKRRATARPTKKTVNSPSAPAAGELPLPPPPDLPPGVELRSRPKTPKPRSTPRPAVSPTSRPSKSSPSEDSAKDEVSEGSKEDSAASGFSLPDGVALNGLVGHYEGLKHFGSDSLQSNVIIGTNSQVPMGENFRLKAAGWVGYFRNTLSRPDSHGRAEFREASLAFSRSGIDLEAGQLFYPWGKADGINPTDYLTGKDLRFLSSEDSYRRRGAPGMSLGFSPNAGVSPVRFDLVYLRRFAQTTLYIPPSVIPPAIRFDPSIPPNDAREFAGKISYTGEGWDASVSGFVGKNHFPQFVANGLDVRQKYFDKKAIGADFSKSFDDWVFRLEGAYSIQESLSQMRSEPDHFDGVIGLERGFGDHARLITQFIYRYNAGWSDPVSTYTSQNPIDTQIGRSIATANALLLNYQNESNPGATVSYQHSTANDDWKFEGSAIVYFITGDYLLKPMLSYKVSDHLRAQLGMEYYGGPEDTPLGILRDNRNVFGELRVFF